MEEKKRDESRIQFLDRILKFLNDNAKVSDNEYIQLDKNDLFTLADYSIDVLQDPKYAKTLLEIQAPVCVIGDLHGQFTDLMKFLDAGKQAGKTPDKDNFLFLGDYVDRGINSCATLAMLLCLKCRYPEKVNLIRGNHETRDISKLYGFYDEIMERFNNEELWEKFNDVFDLLPLGAIISERIFCVHGGLSQYLNDIQQIKDIKRPLKDVPEEGLVADLLWADPDIKCNGFEPSERGTSFVFGPQVAEEFLSKNDFDLICRAHQVVNDGFEFPFFPDQTVVTVFSAPNYCGEFGNKGAMLLIDDNLVCSFKFVDPPANVIPSQRAQTPYYPNSY